MKSIWCGVVPLAALLAIAPKAGGQEIPASSWVLPGGTVRVGVGLEYSHFDSRFATSGVEPWAAGLAGPLNATNFAPLATVQGQLNEFFAATGGGASAGGSDLSLGEPDLGLSADTRQVPMDFAIGVLPRVDVGVTIPLYRSELQVSRFGLSGGTVGENPAPQANAAAFAKLGAEFEALGRSPLLPLAGSALGVALKERVEAAGGQLELPDTPAGDSLFNSTLIRSLGLAPLETHSERWRVGDVRAHARVRILSTLGSDLFPTDSAALHYRLTANVGARLPTGSEPDTLRLFTPSPSVGVSGWSAGLAGDVFIGRHGWIAAAASYSAAQTTDVRRRVVPRDQPFASADAPQDVRWSPPSELRVLVSPRWRLEESIALGLQYELLGVGESRFEGAGGAASVLDLSGGSIQRLGGSARFTTLPGYARNSGVLPAEAVLSYLRTISGPAGFPEGSSLTVEGRIYHRFWGEQRP